MIICFLIISIVFLWLKDWFDHGKDWITLVDLFKKLVKAQLIFLKDQKDRKIKDWKIKRTNSQPWRIIILICIKKLFCFGHKRVKKWANLSFLWSKDRFDGEKDQIALVDPLIRSMGSICSWLNFLKDWRDRLAHFDLFKRLKGSISSRLIFLKDWWDWLALFDLFKRSMRVIQSRSIFLKDWREQFHHGQSF